MHRSKMRVFIAMLLLSALLTAGCQAQSTQAGTANAAQTSSAADTAASSSSAAPSASANPSDAQNALPSSPSNESPKNATWVVDINDTTTYTDEKGIIWNYTLTFHASKPGGTNATGEYMGDAILKIEPDIASVQAAAASEGTTLLSMTFNYYAECESLSFVVEKYSDEPEDGPLAPLSNTDFSADSSATFNSTQEPVSMTILHDGAPKTGSVGGGGATVNVPFTIAITGASVNVLFENLPQPLEYAFKGTITGDVLPT